jgi:uncharacterized protein with GYD domain
MVQRRYGTPSSGVSRNINAGRFAMLYCISANYTPKAMQAMAKKPNTNRRDAVEKLVKAAGAKLVAMYGTIHDGPGAMVIIDVDRIVAPAIAAIVASSDSVHNVKAHRIYTMEEVTAIRKKRVELQASYSPPGQ